MPKVPIDYSKTIIYKIQHNDKPELLYVGHTTNWSKRKNEHKRMSIKEDSRQAHQKLYNMIRENGGWDEFDMVQIKVFPCENTQEAHMEEDKMIREMKATLNDRRAHRTIEEQKARDKITSLANYEANKEEICEKVRQYRIKNKEAINEKDRARYIIRKEQVKAQKSIKITCECGCETVRANMLRHKRSQKHIKLMEAKNE